MAGEAGSAEADTDGQTEIVGPPADVLAAQHDHAAGQFQTARDELCQTLAFHQTPQLFLAHVTVHQVVALRTENDFHLHWSLLAGNDLHRLLQKILQSIELEILGVQSAEETHVGILNTCKQLCLKRLREIFRPIHTFQTDHDLERNVAVFRDTVVGTAGDDERSAGFLAVNGDELETTAETVFLVLEIENAVAGTEEVGLDVGHAAQQQLQLLGNRLGTGVLRLGVVLYKRHCIHENFVQS